MSPDFLVATGQVALAALALLMLASSDTYVYRGISVLTALALAAVSAGLLAVSPYQRRRRWHLCGRVARHLRHPRLRPPPYVT